MERAAKTWYNVRYHDERLIGPARPVGGNEMRTMTVCRQHPRTHLHNTIRGMAGE